jgi:hypothetical protein
LSVSYQVTLEGMRGADVQSDVEKEAVRQVLASLEMTPHIAMMLGQYLIDCAKRRGVEAPAAETATGAQQVH